MSSTACIKWIKIGSPSFKPTLIVGLLLASSQVNIASLIFLALDLVIGPSGTCKGSLRLGPLWFPSRGLLRQKWAKFSSGTILPPNAPHSQLGPENRYGDDFIKKFQTKTCFLGTTKLHIGTLLPQIAPWSPFGHENRWGAISYKNSKRKRVFSKNEYERAVETKLSKGFVRTHHIAN